MYGLAVFPLIERYHSYGWVVLVSWVNYLTLTVELWNYFTQHQLWINSPYFTSTMPRPTVSLDYSRVFSDYFHVLYVKNSSSAQEQLGALPYNFIVNIGFKRIG